MHARVDGIYDDRHDPCIYSSSKRRLYFKCLTDGQCASDAILMKSIAPVSAAIRNTFSAQQRLMVFLSALSASPKYGVTEAHRLDNMFWINRTVLVERHAVGSRSIEILEKIHVIAN